MDSERFFLDTSFIIALLNPRDSYHQEALTLNPRMRAAREVWLTEAILIELGNTFSHVNRKGAATFIESCYHTPNMHIVQVDTSLLLRSVKFYKDRTDKTWGLTDCITFVVMQEHGLIDGLTTDEHFQQAGFRALLREN